MDTSHSAWRIGKPELATLGVVLMVNLGLRVLWLDRLPGINGDEAWYGVQVQRMLTGQAWTAQTPSRLPINPLLFLSEAALLKLSPHEPSLLLLRLPIAFWAASGVLLTYWLHRRVFGDPVEALLTATVTACLPAHLAYSRLCWDASFGFAALPLLLYGTLQLTNRPKRNQALGWLVAGAISSLWVHVTSGLFLAACVLALAWNGLRNRILPCRGLILLAVLALAIWGPRGALWLLSRADLRSLAQLLDRLHAVAVVHDLLIGSRIYEYLAGGPPAGPRGLSYPLFLAATGTVLVLLYRRGSVADRLLVRIVLLVLVAIILVAERLRLRDLSYERYMLYVVPLGVAVLVRGVVCLTRRLADAARPNSAERDDHLASLATMFTGTWEPRWPAAILVLLAAACVAQFWYGYFQPLRRATYGDRLHRAFRSGMLEPKAAAAAVIRAHLSRAPRAPSQIGAGPPRRVFAEDWWVHQPLEYLLAGRAEVLTARPDEIGTGAYAVGFAGSPFCDVVRQRAGHQHWHLQEHAFADPRGQPILILFVLSLPPTEPRIRSAVQ